MSNVDRIAWCLDLAYPDAAETKALLGESVGLREDPRGTAILVGLLCRSSVVLDDELSAIGISSRQLSEEWISELDHALKQQVNELIAADDYKSACLVGELKSKFLFAPIADLQREKHAKPVATREAARETDAGVGDAAKALAEEALEEQVGASARGDVRGWPWARLAQLGTGIAVACMMAVATIQILLPDAGLDRIGSVELARVSPYLRQGSRSLGGSGPVFVGTIDDAWLELEAEVQRQEADLLVAMLQARGVSQIMVYDADDALRIQALGTAPVQVLSDR